MPRCRYPTSQWGDFPLIFLLSLSFNGLMDFGVSAKMRHMEPTPIPRIVYAERDGDDIIFEFDSGDCALYPASLLVTILPKAVKIECSASEEVESEPH